MSLSEVRRQLIEAAHYNGKAEDGSPDTTELLEAVQAAHEANMGIAEIQATITAGVMNADKKLQN